MHIALCAASNGLWAELEFEGVMRVFRSVSIGSGIAALGEGDGGYVKFEATLLRFSRVTLRTRQMNLSLICRVRPPDFST